MKQDVKNLEQLRRLAEKLEPKWESVKTANQENRTGELKIVAQCCKPGPCSPK